jgi:[protein-PII] uridylyltransferase
VGDQIRLDYLYVLTICDINGTNPSLWNTWRASLLRKLYTLTKRALTQGLEVIVGKEDRIKDAQNQAMQKLRELGYTRKQVLQLWNSPHEDYFLRESIEDIVWVTEALAAQEDPGEPLVLIRNTQEERSEGATQVAVKAINTAFLFANLTTAFDRMNLSIQAARMYLMGEIECLMTFMLLEADGTPVLLTRQRLDEMQRTLLTYVLATHALPARPGASITRKQRHFTRNTLTALTTQEEQPYSILEVLCPDRQGLLAVIAHIFVDMGITLHNAKITTLGENVEDVFFITGPDNQPLLDPVAGDALQEAIRTRLDEATRS